MKKFVFSLLVAVFAVSTSQVVHAEDQKVIAIIDTAVDSNKIPSVIYEACFTQFGSCPNKSNFMEGKGSANATDINGALAWPTTITHATYHGYNMTQAAVKVAPDTKVVFVRIADIYSATSSINNPESIIAALKWVAANAEKYSIDAVSISQSGIYTDPVTKVKTYSPYCTNASAISSVSTLSSKNVPVFAATGNDGLKTLVGFPACVTGAVGIGALGSVKEGVAPSEYKVLASITNSGPGLDAVAQPDILIVRYNGTSAYTSGTSGATAIASSLYISKSNSKPFGEFVLTLNKVAGYPYISR